MSTSPSSQPTGKRKRKTQRIVESDNDSEYEQPFRAETSPGPTSPSKPPTKKKTITRTPRRTAVKSPEKVNSQEESQDDNTPTSPTGTPAMEGKAKDKSDGERPAKRPRLPSMRRAASTTTTSTPVGSNTPTVEKVAPLAPGSSATAPTRRIVDGPVSNDIDMRDENAFSQLLRKNSGKPEIRHDLTITEKMELKRAELAKLREEYIEQKARERATPFDLGAQNRKLVDVQRLLERRGSRVCVNVVGSCILTVHKDWIKLAAEKEAATGMPE